MSLGLIVVIVLVIFLLGGFSGRFGGYGYGYGHGGVGIIGTILIIVVILMLLGRLWDARTAALKRDRIAAQIFWVILWQERTLFSDSHREHCGFTLRKQRLSLALSW
jgi:hypothetical protein